MAWGDYKNGNVFTPPSLINVVKGVEAVQVVVVVNVTVVDN